VRLYRHIKSRAHCHSPDGHKTKESRARCHSLNGRKTGVNRKFGATRYNRTEYQLPHKLAAQLYIKPSTIYGHREPLLNRYS